MDASVFIVTAAAPELLPKFIPHRPQRRCLECGQPIASKRAEFCCVSHRKDFNNRRAMRGAEIYDLLMEWRFDRATAAVRGTWSTLCTLLGRFNDEDKERARKIGIPFRSWSPSKRMMMDVHSRLSR